MAAFSQLKEQLKEEDSPKPKSKAKAKPAAEAKVPATKEAPAEKEIAPKKAASKDTAEKSDNLKIIEGVGPKIEEILHNSGLKSYSQVSDTTPDAIREILIAAGSRYKMHDPTTWPEQAKLAASGEFDKLKELQDSLQGGKK
jgi:predicted flap endonuclease-1-like 5' DNA nuclease